MTLTISPNASEIFINENLHIEAVNKNLKLKLVRDATIIIYKPFYERAKIGISQMLTSDIKEDLKEGIGDSNTIEAYNIHSRLMVGLMRFNIIPIYYSKNYLTGEIECCREGELESKLYVELLAVAPDFQKQEIGSLLMKCAFDIATEKKCRKVDLYVDSEHLFGYYVVKLGMEKNNNFVFNHFKKEITSYPVKANDLPTYLDLAVSSQQTYRAIPLFNPIDL